MLIRRECDPQGQKGAVLSRCPRWLMWVCCLCVTWSLWGCPQRAQVRKTPNKPNALRPVTKRPPARAIARPTPPRPRPAPAVAPRPRPALVRGQRRLRPPRPIKPGRRSGTVSYHSFNSYRFYLRGQIHAVEGRGKKAVLAFKSALVYDPKSVVLRQRIALQYYKNKSLKKARFWARQALRFRKTYAPAYYLLGKIALDLRKRPEAIRLFRSAITHAPKYADAYLALNKALQSSSNGTRMQIRILKLMISHLPERYEGYYHLAHLRQNQGRVAKALRLYKQAINRKPSHHASLFQLAQLYEQQKRWKQAIKTYRVLLDYQPNSWQTHVTVACLYLKHGEARDTQMAGYHFRYIMREATQISAAERSFHIGSGLLQCSAHTSALRWLKKALALQRNYPLARLTLGIAYANAGKPRRALPLFRAVSPKKRNVYVEAQIHLLQTLLKLGQNKQAWLALERARIQLARHPNEWIKLSQLFVERAPQKALAQEVQQLKAQISNLPNHKGLLHLLSFVYFKQKKYSACEQQLLKIIKKDAKHAASLNFLGYLYAVLGRKLPKAERLVKRALKLSPKNPYYLDSLGWIYYRQGRLSRARQVLELALRQLPEDTTILLHLGRTYHRQRLWKRARKMYHKARRLKPPPHLIRQIDTALQKLKRRIPVRSARIEP